MKPKVILLASDLSCRTDRALDRSAQLASEWGARLVVAHALGDPPDPAVLPPGSRAKDPIQTAMERVAADLVGFSGLDIEVIVDRGDPAPVILEAIERTGCGLAVTGVARDETLGRFLLGTTVEKIARRAGVPVLVVKSRPRGPYRKVIVATDFSPGSRVALDTVSAWMPQADIRLFHAYDPAYEGLVDDREALREAARIRAEEEAREFLAAVPDQGSIPADLGHGVPEEAVPDWAWANRADLVALGSVGRSRLADLMLGSVAYKLLQSVPVDVLVAPRPRD
jgi:nucleotide-binding universal stress UspA family protein